MSDNNENAPAPTKRAKGGKFDQRAKALRDNLQKRKRQQRDKAAPGGADNKEKT